MAQTLYWYDLETFGRDPLADRIAQFAGIRTDAQFREIGEPLVLYNRITPDYLPDPGACIVTGITPQLTLGEGLNEYEFISRIRAEMTVPGTTVLGYNNIRFDDEFIRAALYRSFYDPYEREWAGGNSRWDILDLLRAARDLRPDGIEWPLGEDGKPSFRLENLTLANGIGHEHAHDALEDVRATIGIAKLVHTAQPKLFHFYFSHRKKEDQRRLVNLADMTPLLHTSAAYTRREGCTTLVAPLAVDPQIRNHLIALDLRYDPSPLFDLDTAEIRRRIFSSRRELEAEQELYKRFGVEPDGAEAIQDGFGGRIPLVTIALNRCPFLAPLSTLEEDGAERLGLPLPVCMEHLRVLKTHPQLIQKIVEVFSDEGKPAAPEPKDPDLLLYAGGFFRDEDRKQFEAIHTALASRPPAEARPALYSLAFLDPRVPQMLRRFFARNYPETLATREIERWNSFCAGRILYPPSRKGTDLATYTKIILAKMESSETPARHKIILKELIDYKRMLEETVLAYRPAGSPERDL